MGPRIIISNSKPGFSQNFAKETEVHSNMKDVCIIIGGTKFSITRGGGTGSREGVIIK